jgi:hypothetical protein
VKKVRRQTANAVMMIKPVKFGYNEETAISNAFQQKEALNPEKIQSLAAQEFDDFVAFLRKQQIEVLVFEDIPDSHSPDAIFTNNWISTHDDGTVILYPMMAANRRLERRNDIIDSLQNVYHFDVNKIVDYSSHEQHGRYLEGTGSVVFDYANGIAYANISDRTERSILKELCELLHFEMMDFRAIDKQGKDIYHTNVVMCIGEAFATICLQAIPEETERQRVKDKLLSSGHEIIDINYDQLYAFAGNMIQVRNDNDEKYIILSKAAYRQLSSEQLDVLASNGTLLPVAIPTIEKVGGGSVRCMVAAIHLPKRSFDV